MSRPRVWIAFLLLVGCVGFFVRLRMPAPAPEPSLDAAAVRELARLGEGFVVWERKAGASWQIWMKSLDGVGDEKRVVPEEEGRDHFCPKISPDGRKLAYMSYARGTTPYEAGTGVLWMQDLASGTRSRLVQNARSYGGNRAVVWYGNDRLCYADEAGHAVELEINTGARQVLTKVPSKNGWLVNAQKTHITSDDPEFALRDHEGNVAAQTKHGGCQPYFSPDGRWGFWMGGSGGPVNKMFLPTRMVGQILGLNDPRLPSGRNYIYFPMLSGCQRLMAFAASPDDHDHFTSDYDIYVIRVDAETLEPIGQAVRYTTFEGTDRFPDVHCHELPLGSHFVEGPTKVELRVPGQSECLWHVDGLEVGRHAFLAREFATVGDHWVTATATDGATWRGLVHVSEPRAPKLTLVRRMEGKALALTFDNAVSLDAATFMTDDGAALPLGERSAENYRVVLPVSRDVRAGTRITLEGVRDLAARPNVMPRTTFTLPGVGWPQSREGLLFAWEGRSSVLEGMPPSSLERTGKAFWNSRGGMDVRGGSFEIPGAGTRILRECQKTGAFSLEAMLTPMVPPYDKAMRPLLSLEDDAGNVKLCLLHRQSALSLWLATQDNPRGTSREQDLMPIKTGQPLHMVLSYEAGRFHLTVNGALLWVQSEYHGALQWEAAAGRLRIGACSRLENTWPGMVEQLAWHSRVLTASEAAAHADHAAPKLASQRKVRPQKVVTKLLQATRIPTLAEISPYREGLVEQLYEVLPKDDGDDLQHFPVGSRIAITHWAWVNGEAATTPPSKAGDTYRLFVQPREAHKEIASLVVRSDRIPLEAPQFLDVSNW